jgi:hypothetical protein
MAAAMAEGTPPTMRLQEAAAAAVSIERRASRRLDVDVDEEVATTEATTCTSSSSPRLALVPP